MTTARAYEIWAGIFDALYFDLAEQSRDLVGIDNPGAEVLRGLGSARNREAQTTPRGRTGCHSAPAT